MSHVTGIVIYSSSLDEDQFDVLNKWLNERGYASLVNTASFSGGSNHPQMNIWAGGYNYFPDSDFVEFFKSYEWYDATLILNPEDNQMVIIESGTAS